ncbi:MAG TPA: tRNA-dihydrouridine synthase [Solirubrobacteraceae bacterium]|nr:tRNA-dihydrouridine synthase [Solirubrobacteraceae bacterium]
MPERLTDAWTLGPHTVPNRVLLAPLAGIGNWFVRLQARRHGAGMAVSEMVSSFAVHHRNERTVTELLRIHPDERGDAAPGGRAPISIQLFGHDPGVMRSAAETVAQAGADVIDLNMGCPVPKVCRTGAGAALLDDPDRAVALARAAAQGSGLPVTVKLRSGRRAGGTEGFDLARRLVADAGVAAIAFHPRSASVHHKGVPDYDLAARLVAQLGAPVILTGGLRSPEAVAAAYERTGATAVMLARGSLGDPWLFERVLGRRDHGPSEEEVLAELDWVIGRAIEHLGEPRAARWMRKAYPWYVARLGLPRPEARDVNDALQRSESTAAARSLVRRAAAPATVA